MIFKPYLRIDDRFSFHLARPELAEAVFATVEANRSYLREWLPWVDVTLSVENTRAFIQESMTHNMEGTRLTMFILDREEVAGALGVVSFNRDHRSCEIGYWLRQDLQGQGIMTKACRCLIDHLFKTRAINRIEIRVNLENLKSMGIPVRLGFTREGVLRQSLFMNGAFHDIVMFSFLKEEWLSAN